MSDESSSAHRAAAAAALALVAAACTPAPRPAPPPAAVTAAAPAAVAGRHYRLDVEHSTLTILAYRAGPLARLGHNHVLIARTLEGEVTLPADPAAARFRLAFPVATLAIDEPAARAAEGEAFASVPSAADIEGTRRNLLGPAVLDATTFPRLAIEGHGARADGALAAVAVVTVRGHESTLSVPVALTTEAGSGALLAEGAFELRQSDLGLEPFSIGLGALQVRDALAIRFRLRATPDEAPPGTGASP
ncbi:MAG: YceI family protein [Proteobacteria bacterium]|nr:YceI family protein [Pseudomonadota bacterium]